MELSVSLRMAVFPADETWVRQLLESYFDSLRAHPGVPAAIRDKDRRPELDALAGRYTDANAALYLAIQGEQLCGCAAVARLATRADAAELKRLFVRPETRGCGVGRALVLQCAAWAREHGARELLLDTLPEAMPEAVRLYCSVGFERTARYNENEGCCFAFFRLSLG